MSIWGRKMIRTSLATLFGVFLLLSGTFTVHATEVIEAVEVTEESVTTNGFIDFSDIEISDEDIYTDGGTFNGLTWAVYNKGTMLVITGNGAMSPEGETLNADSYPWYKYNVVVNIVKIGDGVTDVGMNAFREMAGLHTVELGSGITVIEKSAFYGCSSLKSINIPDSVKEIGNFSFYECSSLEAFSVTDNSQLTTIGEQAFFKCEGLKTVSLGKKLETINKSAFSWCPITSVVLPDSIRTIGDGAFYRSALQTVNFPYGLQSIGDDAFGVTKIKGTVVIPSSVTFLGEDIFGECWGITKAEIYASCKIGNYMFYGLNNLKEVIIGDQVTGIGSYAFAYIDYLENVAIGKNVSSIGLGAFQSSGLEAIVIPDNVKSLGSDAFNNCDNLKKVTLGAGITTISFCTFRSCRALETVTIKGDVTWIEYNAFEHCSALKILDLPDTVEKIYNNAFADCDGLTSVTLPDSVEMIGVEAFSDCDNLTSVTVGSNVRSIYADVFKDSPITKFTSYSENTVFSDNSIYSSNSNFTMYGWSGSTTNTYADSNGITFVPLSLKTTTVSKLTTEASGVHVYWNEVPYAKTYDVYRSTSKTSGYSLIKSGVTTTDYKDTNVKSGTTYYYKVVAVRDTRKSGYSAATDGITYIAAPTFKKIVNVVSGVHVYWNASSGAKTYSVYRSTKKDSGYTLVKSGLTATHYIDTTVKSGTTYYYKIIALKGSMKSAFSAPFKPITYVGTPDITSRFNKGAGVQLGWNKIAGATGYAIYRKPYDGNTWTRVTTIEGNKTFTWMDESVKTNNGTVYKYTIRALAGSDMKTLSGCRNTGRTMARLTSRTLNSATKASVTSIKCNWSTTAVCNGYEVRFMVGDTVYKTFTVGNYKTGVKTFTGLKAGQTYKIQVRSYKKVDGVGTFYSAWSTAKTVRL